MFGASGGESWRPTTSRSKRRSPKWGRMQWTVRTPRRASHSATGAARRPAEMVSAGQGAAKAAAGLGVSPARVGQRSGSRARGPQPSGTVRNGRSSRSAMPSACAAVPARGSASTQMRFACVSVMDGARPADYDRTTKDQHQDEPP